MRWGSSQPHPLAIACCTGRRSARPRPRWRIRRWRRHPSARDSAAVLRQERLDLAAPRVLQPLQRPPSSMPITWNSPRHRPRKSRTACVASSTSRPGRGSSANVRKLPDTFRRYAPSVAPRPKQSDDPVQGRPRIGRKPPSRFMRRGLPSGAGGRWTPSLAVRGGAIGPQTLAPNRRSHGAVGCRWREQCRCNGLLANGKWRDRVLTRARLAGQ